MKAWIMKNYTLQENYKHFKDFLKLAVRKRWEIIFNYVTSISLRPTMKSR
jgi:hypothetical protein